MQMSYACVIIYDRHKTTIYHSMAYNFLADMQMICDKLIAAYALVIVLSRFTVSIHIQRRFRKLTQLINIKWKQYDIK